MRPVETVFDACYKAGKYLTFRVARQDFAIASECVRGILPLHQIVALESPHSWLCGFASAGGPDFPVIDLRAKFGIARGPRGREPFIVVVETTGGLAGFIADRVSEILDLRARDFRNGALRGHGRSRRVLEPDQLLTPEDWVSIKVR